MVIKPAIKYINFSNYKASICKALRGLSSGENNCRVNNKMAWIIGGDIKGTFPFRLNRPSTKIVGQLII
jgi:hypothetical protein